MSSSFCNLYLDDTHVTDEGEEVEEGWLDAVVEVAAASRLAAWGAAALEGLVWLVETKEESVIHIILRHTTSASQSSGYRRGEVTIIQPGKIHIFKLDIQTVYRQSGTQGVTMPVCLYACLYGTNFSKGLFIFLIQIFQMFSLLLSALSQTEPKILCIV